MAVLQERLERRKMFHIKKRVKEIDEQLAAKRKETHDKMAEVGPALLPLVCCAFLCLA